MQAKFFHSLLWRLLVPVIVIGTLSSLLLGYYLIPPLVSSLEQRINKTISHTGSMAFGICEERLRDMLDLRLEENREMNNSSKIQAIKEIKKIDIIYPEIKIIIFDSSGTIQASTFTPPTYQPKRLLESLANIQDTRTVSSAKLLDEDVYLHHEYFPFWRWHIVSFMTHKDYFHPIYMAKRIVNFGTFGTLIAVIFSVILLFILRINMPLKQIIRTTEEVRRGNFDKVNLEGQGEIVQVAVAFDHMVEKLENDKHAINTILDDLRESEEKYRILSENTLSLVLVANQNGLQYANRAAAIFFSLAPSDLKTRDIYSLFEPHERKKLHHHIDELAKARSGVEYFELSYKPPAGEVRWLEVVASVIPYLGVSSVLFHAIDVSGRKRMEINQEAMRQKIVRSEQMEILGTLAGGVAHDLNNILGGVVSYPELLLQELDEKDRYYAPLKTIHQSGLKAAAIVQDLLTLTRRGVVITEIVNLGNILNDYFDSPEFAHLCSYFPEIEIRHSIQDGLMNIKGSYHHLSKCIMNLVNNAAEALPAGGTVLIRAENGYVDKPIGNYDDVQEGEYVILSIEDNGAGISKEDLSRIFEPFYTKKVMGRSGTGLGMSVVWGAVKDHNGYIDICSEQGRGSTFTLYFPASRVPLEDKKIERKFAVPKGNGEKILVIDDIEEQRLIAATMLERLGYSVDVAGSGEEAVRVLKTANYDLVLLDMIMEPGMDGLDTYREILKLKPEQKAIIASGFSETERVRSAMKLGAGAYLKKPYGLEKLAVTVKAELTGNDK
jgi:PAS domain S-box-containing protein